MLRPRIYMQSRRLTGDIAREKPSELPWMDTINPRLLSNNMMIPYLIGCWEAYFRSSYISMLKYLEDIPDKALKNCRISSAGYRRVIKQEAQLESVLADSLSFQRPCVIAENFRQLYPRIDIAAWLKKPYRRRRISLFDSIDKLVETRNMLVHTGEMDRRIFDREISSIIGDLTAAVQRSYEGVAEVIGFYPEKIF